MVIHLLKDKIKVEKVVNAGVISIGEKRIYYNTCMRDCYDTCLLETKVVDEKIRVKGSKSFPITDGFLCYKGYILPKWLYSKERLKSAYIRKNGRLLKASIDEAINVVASKMKDFIDRGMAYKILLYQFAGDRGVVNYHFPMRLFHKIGATFLDYGICDRAGQEALKKIYGTSVGMVPEELKKEKLIVYWGMNPAWTNLHGFSLVKKYGLEVWTVDVRTTPTMKASSKGFIVKPGMDAEFALYVAKAMVENGWYDKNFSKNYIENFEDFEEFLSNIAWDDVKKTGLSKEDILNFAKGLWEKKGVIHIGYGFQRSRNGARSVKYVGILPILSGHKCGFLYDMKVLDKSYAEGKFLRKGPFRTVPQMKVTEYIENGNIEMIYIYNANPLNSHQNVNRLKKAFEKIFVVVHDIFMTETAQAADVVLPSSTFFERLDIVDSYYHDYILLNEPVVKLWGYSNREITMMLAKKLGFKDKYLYEVEEEIIKKVLKDSGLSWDELREKKFIKGRKISNCKDSVRVDLDDIEKSEDVELEKDEFILITPTHYSTITSQYYNLHDKFDEYVHMNPEDGRQMKLNPGDVVEVFNEYGRLISNVKFSEDVQKGTVVIFKGSWQNLSKRNVNSLIGDEVQESCGNASIYHGFKVRVRRIRGDMSETL